MTIAAPFIFSDEKSLEVLEKSKKFVEEQDLNKKISDLGWAYHTIGKVIPHTIESFWSGHFFPYVESWEDIQISYNLCLFGFYKQAMATLRSGLELGLLSVYWNLNDDGHMIIKEWISSKSDTPSLADIWQKFIKNNNFKSFQAKYPIKDHLLSLNYLHNYVHTKGRKYSNSLGLLKGNYQTFETKGFELWLNCFEEVTRVVGILHLIKYPIGTVSYDWSSKFGIDIPSFGGLEQFEIDRLANLFGESIFEILRDIANNDDDLQNLMSYIDSLPDMTEEEVEEQFVNFDKMNIQQMGFEPWLKQELMLYEKHIQTDKKLESRIERLRIWAIENNFVKSAIERLREEKAHLEPTKS